VIHAAAGETFLHYYALCTIFQLCNSSMLLFPVWGPRAVLE